MIVYKILLLVALTVIPIHLAFARRLISWVVLAGLVGFWMFYPSWGPWVYVGVCLNLVQWRIWVLYVKKLCLATYISSPSMVIQNGSSLELAIGAVVGGIRSFVGDDILGAIMGGTIAALLFFLQGLLFPNPTVILQACGHSVDDIQPEKAAEVMRQLETIDYPTLLKLDRQRRN